MSQVSQDTIHSTKVYSVWPDQHLFLKLNELTDCLNDKFHVKINFWVLLKERKEELFYFHVSTSLEPGQLLQVLQASWMSSFPAWPLWVFITPTGLTESEWTPCITKSKSLSFSSQTSKTCLGSSKRRIQLLLPLLLVPLHKREMIHLIGKIPEDPVLREWTHSCLKSRKEAPPSCEIGDCLYQ